MKHILEYLERTTAQKPDKTAVIDGERSISFQELTHEAKLLASYILQKDTAVTHLLGQGEIGMVACSAIPPTALSCL